MSSSVGCDSSWMPCGAPEAHMLRCSTESPVIPAGCGSLMRNGTTAACAYFSGAVRVIQVLQPPAAAVPLTVGSMDLIWLTSRFVPASM